MSPDYSGAAWNAMHEECTKTEVIEMWMDAQAEIRELKERVGGLVIVLAAADGALIQNGLGDFAATIRATVNDVLNPKETA